MRGAEEKAHIFTDAERIAFRGAPFSLGGVNIRVADATVGDGDVDILRAHTAAKKLVVRHMTLLVDGRHRVDLDLLALIRTHLDTRSTTDEKKVFFA